MAHVNFWEGHFWPRNMGGLAGLKDHFSPFILLMEEILHKLRLVLCPIIYRVFLLTSQVVGLGISEPSTVSGYHVFKFGRCQFPLEQRNNSLSSGGLALFHHQDHCRTLFWAIHLGCQTPRWRYVVYIYFLLNCFNLCKIWSSLLCWSRFNQYFVTLWSDVGHALNVARTYIYTLALSMPNTSVLVIDGKACWFQLQWCDCDAVASLVAK